METLQPLPIITALFWFDYITWKYLPIFSSPNTHTNCICFPRILQNNSHVSTHSWLPWTSTTKLHSAMLPLLSCAVQVTFVCSIGNLVPDLGVHVMFGSWLELSTASGSFHTTTAVDCPGSVGWVWFCGQNSNTGDSMSGMKIHLFYVYRMSTVIFHILLLIQLFTCLWWTLMFTIAC